MYIGHTFYCNMGNWKNVKMSKHLSIFRVFAEHKIINKQTPKKRGEKKKNGEEEEKRKKGKRN